MFVEHGFAVESADADTDGQDPTLAALAAAVDAVVGTSPDALDEPQLKARLAGLERQLRRLQAHSGELARAVTARQAKRARQANPGDVRAGERGARQARDELAQQLQWSPGQAKRTVETAQQLEGLPQAQAAFRAGQLGAEQARVLTRTLNQLWPRQREQAEARLVAAARVEDPVTFGRTARRVLAELDQDAAMADLDRKHAQRSGRLAQDPDGMTRLQLSVTGIDGEIVATAIHAYRRPDAPGEHRSSEQATADELTLLCRRHHRYLDRQHATARLEHGRIVWYRPDGTPVGARRPPPSGGADPP